SKPPGTLTLQVIGSRWWAGRGSARDGAWVVYKMLKYKVEYNPLSVNEYQKKYDEQQIKYMKKKAVVDRSK
ncbi:MAG: hypothetical protein ACUVRJ_10920, partial [Candidatus Villigracilaceae bacterium]